MMKNLPSAALLLIAALCMGGHYTSLQAVPPAEIAPVVSSPPPPLIIESGVEAADLEFALVDGKYIQTKTVEVGAIVHVDVAAEGVKVSARRVVAVNGVEFLAADIVRAIPVEQQKEGHRCYGLVGPLKGKKYQVLIDSYDPATKVWDTEVLNLELEEPDVPDPDVPDPDVPDPDVPDDAFDNIGQRAAGWSKGLPKRQEVGSIYLSAATGLELGEIVSINDAGKKIVEGTRDSLTDAEREKWKKFAENLQQDLNGRWPLSRQLYIDYMKSVAKGLGAQ